MNVLESSEKRSEQIALEYARIILEKFKEKKPDDLLIYEKFLGEKLVENVATSLGRDAVDTATFSYEHLLLKDDILLELGLKCLEDVLEWGLSNELANKKNK